jgi:aminopeptidase N
MVRFIFILLLSLSAKAQKSFVLDDTLRGSISPERSWWDLKHYDLRVHVDIANKSIQGSNTIRFKVIGPKQRFQIDLQEPLILDSVIHNGQKLHFETLGHNARMVDLGKAQLKMNAEYKVTAYYHGKPKPAKRAPWDGGFSWSKDAKARPFVATSCQGLGASVWWPCKDHMYDEPDSMLITASVPDELWNISNGRLRSMHLDPNGVRTTTWAVMNPINNYGVNLNIGHYSMFSEKYKGEKGDLDCQYYVLTDNLEKAKKQFKDAERTLKAFEHWFGPYPFYEDSYKLVEVPYLGMEHQSSVTYGNKFSNGYLGTDLSGTGWGLKWDFIIVHESGHEWFANNITYKDVADMWIHESFTNYSETLFTEYYYGLSAGQDYVIGTRKNIKNDKPIIGVYNVNKEGSSDMYYKGGNMIHTIRHIINDDEKFRAILRGLNATFYHKTVTSAEIEQYISKSAGRDFSKVFDQYLRKVSVPKLETNKSKKSIKYRFTDCEPDFSMPLKVEIDGQIKWIDVSSRWKSVKGKNLKVDRNFYVL